MWNRVLKYKNQNNGIKKRSVGSFIIRTGVVRNALHTPPPYKRSSWFGRRVVLSRLNNTVHFCPLEGYAIVLAHLWSDKIYSELPRSFETTTGTRQVSHLSISVFYFAMDKVMKDVWDVSTSKFQLRRRCVT